MHLHVCIWHAFIQSDFFDQKYSKIVKYYNSYKVAVFKVLYFLEILKI